MEASETAGVTGGLVRGGLSQKADVKQLEEAKETLEGQLKGIRLQLERDGYTSLAQMRYIFVSKILKKQLTVVLLLSLPLNY